MTRNEVMTEEKRNSGKWNREDARVGSRKQKTHVVRCRREDRLLAEGQLWHT